MTREEKINTLKAIIQECEEYQWRRKETLFEIIKDLEQETVSKESYDHEYFLRNELEMKIARLEQHKPVLDKIRAEIEKWHKGGTNWSDLRLMKIEDIFNEYKAESEK